MGPSPIGPVYLSRNVGTQRTQGWTHRDGHIRRKDFVRTPKSQRERPRRNAGPEEMPVSDF